MSKRSIKKKVSGPRARGAASREKKRTDDKKSSASAHKVRDRLPELTGEDYQSCLAQLHNVFRPRSYLEIGTLRGDTLKLAQCAAIAVDPKIRLQRLPTEHMPALCLFQMRSDDFFATHDPRSILGVPVDFAFIDGLHLVEYALRDFMNTEKVCHPQSLIAFHDCVPLDHPMAVRDIADRERALSAHPDWWAGDVWKILLILSRYRPDLTIEVFNAPPTGLVLVRKLDPESRVLKENYREILDEFRTPKNESTMFKKFLSNLNITDTSKLTKTLGQSPFESKRRLAGVELLQEELAEHGWPPCPESDDLAFCKPAVSSSVSPWSRHQFPVQDASGANGEFLAWDYAFHTSQETDPWWLVDLLGECLIEEVAIVNRQSQSHRFKTFRIETSLDGNSWTTRFTQTEPRDISSDPDWPWQIHFPEPFPARYVRIVLLGFGILHLVRVQVFGAGSAVSPKRLIARLLAKYPPQDFFQTGSELREKLISQAPYEDIVEPLRRALVKERDHVSLAMLDKEAAAQGWPRWPKSDDLAYCKPAASSSVSPWSWSQDPRRDACGANGEWLADDYGFHTQEEPDPWWMVDLLDEYNIEKVTIVNRHSQSQRFSTFRIESSLDANIWTTRFTQTEPKAISSDPDSPWKAHFSKPFPARYVRIVLLGVGMLHLRRVQIFAVRQGRRW